MRFKDKWFIGIGYRHPLLCTVPRCTNFSYHSLNNTSHSIKQFKFQLPPYVNLSHHIRYKFCANLQFTNHNTTDGRHDQWPLTSLLPKSVRDWPLYICYSFLSQTVMSTVVLPSFFPVINSRNILQQRLKCSKYKVIRLEMKLDAIRRSEKWQKKSKNRMRSRLSWSYGLNYVDKIQWIQKTR